MNTSCPTCGKPVDPLRSRSVGVRDGKVVAYCSPECIASAETRPVAVPKAAPPKETTKPEVTTKGKKAAPTRTPASGIPSGKTPSLDSGPVIEIVRDKTAPVVATKVDPAPPSDADAPPADSWSPEASSKRGLKIALAVLLVGAAAGVGYRLLLGSTKDTSSRAPAPPVTPEVAPTPKAEPASPKPDPHAVVERATTTLRTAMASESPRVQRIAAAALARTKDPAALELLGKALAADTVETSKLEIAYALARGGDDKGLAALVAGTRSARRDTKLEAARLLARLGKPEGASTLTAYLGLEQFRVSAAEHLAYLRDQRAIDTLVKLRADEKALPDDRARATVALAMAGDKTVTPDLQALLENEHFKAQAARALAQLGEPTARAALAEQLVVVQLRVETARALRILEPALDPQPFLPELVAGLESPKDTEQVTSAEAILILAGDRAWSEHP